ncbi:MAG: DegT/DnrJ/EryC1/StrS family aminotransferase, partial [Verrucomicrobiota bacterium]
AQLKSAVTDRTKAIIPVHLYGQAAEMDLINQIAKTNNLMVIEDAAQAIGAEYKGRRLGSVGDYGCFSFFPSKNLGAFGDGGVVTVNDEARYEKLKTLRVHGSRPKYYHQMIGGNFRLDALQAAVVEVKLKYLDRWTESRQRNADRYVRLFQDTGLLDDDVVHLPHIATDRHIFNQFVIRAAQRDALRARLMERKIGSEIYYPVPLHLQECFAHLGYRKGDFPQSEAAAAETLALPIYPELSDAQAEYIVSTIAEFYQNES